MKVSDYNVKYNVGRVKYLVSYHVEGKKHNDGSNFYDIACFKNKTALNNFIKSISL